MSAHFADRLSERIVDRDSRLCVGLDPDLERFPPGLLKKYGLERGHDGPDAGARIAACLGEFCLEVLEATAGLACAVKPQSAYFEAYGPPGAAALSTVCAEAKKRGLPVIMDAKRNDIGSTAQRYARAYLGPDQGPNQAGYPCDALTVTPFLGRDGLIPFIDAAKDSGKGVFVLVKTSNPSGAEVQDLLIEGTRESLADRLADLTGELGRDLTGGCGYSLVGGVIGATHPGSVARLRARMPKAIILMPGFGAQGAGAAGTRDAFDANGLGAVINSSRGIIYPCPPDAPDYFATVRHKARAARDAIQAVIGR